MLISVPFIHIIYGDTVITDNAWFCYETEVLTSTVGMKDENKGRLVQKAKVSSIFYLICHKW